MRFITDATLGKLVKWLRILGYDTISHTGDANRSFLRKAQEEGRIVLTRKRDLAKRDFSGRLLLIQNDHVQDQIRELMDELPLHPQAERLLTICLKCNEKLEEVLREEIAGMVPPYVFENCSQFHTCPSCRGIFWAGTHRDNIHRFFKTHIQSHHP